MILLDTGTTLEIVIDSVPTTELHWNLTYIDTADDHPQQANGVSNGTADVTVLGSPSTDERMVRFFSLFNADNAARTVTVKVDNGANDRIITKQSLQPNAALIYDSAYGWHITPVDPSGGTDTKKLKVSANDTTEDYLEDKLSDTGHVKFTTENDGGNETIKGDVVINHNEVSGQTANDHHNELHSIASHNDTTATGTELETLTDGSNADGLHDHNHSGITDDEAGKHRLINDAGTSATELWSSNKINTEIGNAVVGLYDHKGSYDANTNTPDLDTSPSGIKKGDAYTVSAAGTFFTEAVEIGDVLIADQDDPTTLSHWTRVNKNIDQATETSPGIGEIATQTETDAGTDDNRIVTPQKLANYIAMWDFVVHAGRNNTSVTNQYIRGPGNVPMNQSPYIIPFNATLIGISASCQTSSTWTAEIHSSGTLIPGASLALTAQVSNYVNNLSINVNAGDGIQVYMNGTTINKPVVLAFFKRRT